jgi:hypothetical protein
MMTLLKSIDWPDVIAGAAVAGVIGAMGFGIKSLIQYNAARRSILRYGKGGWFSAEYDPKGNVPKEHRVTYLRVRIKPTWRGRVRIRSIEQMNPEQKAVETGWIAEGRIENGSLIRIQKISRAPVKMG